MPMFLASRPTVRRSGGPRPEGSTAAPGVVHEVLKSPGHALDADTQSWAMGSFGRDFSDVRLHTDSEAAVSAASVNARAYTVGHHIVLGSGQYQPRSSDGRKLLAHELVHTIQQLESGVSSAQLEIGPARDAYEQQADTAVERLGTFSGVAAPQLSFSRLQRQTVQRSPGPDITASTDFSAIQGRLNDIIVNGPPPEGLRTRVIGAAIVDIPNYPGRREIRAISSIAQDVVGEGAEVFHATSPANRTLSATRGIGGASLRGEWPFHHSNDAEMKMFEEIAANIEHMGGDATGTVHFITMRVRQVGGRWVYEPIPACSGCNRATLEMGSFRKVTMISHAPAHPPTTVVDLGDLEASGAAAQAGHSAAAGPAGKSAGPTLANISEFAEEAAAEARAAARGLLREAKFTRAMSFVGKVLPLLAGIGDLLTAIGMISDAESKLESGSFKFPEQQAFANSQAKLAEQMWTGYVANTEMIKTLPDDLLPILWDKGAVAEVSFALAQMRLEMFGDLVSLESWVRQIDEFLQRAEDRKEFAKGVASSQGGQEFSGLMGGSVIATEGFMAYEDLVHITGALRTASENYHRTVEQMRSDLATVDQWFAYLVDWCGGAKECGVSQSLLGVMQASGPLLRFGG
jgi:hypothetical protein